ncbi:MAG: FKBP-type peptidyl-prolyl cis-trans isomerase [Caulobacterales bacterium]|nr:FKBP-type peptidyl-prolyl cis-trans isomerase [Caulobacterales bacterium]
MTLAGVSALAACDASGPRPEATASQEALASCALNALANHRDEPLARSEAFLSCTKGQDRVVTTDTGLQYEVLESGDPSADPPAYGQFVCVHYRGTLIDGSEFDSSYARGAPAVFPSDRLIPGWVEALADMRPGESRRLFIHPALAYGEAGAGGSIGPNEALVFEMSLIKLLNGPSDACP